MDTNKELTSTESSILVEVHQLLGNNLADFLLSGLGEPSVSHRRTFTAQSSASDVDGITYQLEMINDSELGLPIGRDPLILAALLDLLWEGQPLNSTILFRESDIIEKLNWSHHLKSQSLIKRALERYVLTAYCLIDPTIAGEEHLSGRYASINRLLIGYEIVSVLRPSERTGQPRFATRQTGFIRAQFLPALIHDVISDRKTFLGIDFQRLSEKRAAQKTPKHTE